MDPKSKKLSKTVTFSMIPEVHKQIAWAYAYRKARIGTWEQYARDTARFQRSIKTNFEPIIKPVLENKIKQFTRE